MFLFTACESYIVGFVCTRYDPTTVLIAATMTCGLTILLTLYACFTKKDFTVCGVGMLLVLYCFIMFGFLMVVLEPGKTMTIIYSCIGVCIYGCYIVIDT